MKGCNLHVGHVSMASMISDSLRAKLWIWRQDSVPVNSPTTSGIPVSRIPGATWERTRFGQISPREIQAYGGGHLAWISLGLSQMSVVYLHIFVCMNIGNMTL